MAASTGASGLGTHPAGAAQVLFVEAESFVTELRSFVEQMVDLADIGCVCHPVSETIVHETLPDRDGACDSRRYVAALLRWWLALALEPYAQ